MSETTRRGLLAGAAGAGAAAALAACGTSSDTSDTGASAGGAQAQPSSPAGQPSSTAGATGGADGGGSKGGTPIGQTSEIPVGGGKVFSGPKVVVTQPQAGSFKAFSAVCTHAGCLVGTVADGAITCVCHHSEFSAADGSVKRGPARSPLPAKSVTVQGTNIVVS